MNPTKTEAIKRFLEARTHPDLAALYNHDMECQVNVAQDGGNRIEGDFKGRQWHGWSDGIQTWKSFRIPLFANSDPEYTDSPIQFELDQHAEGIGMTGWDWKSRTSRWVAFDFDAITGHSEKHSRKLSDSELRDVENQLRSIPWCTIRKSTSGKGLHLYVFLDPVIPTANHNEHAALARAILGMLAALTRFDFTTKVDICGGNMWVWHRKMSGTPGLQLLKAGTSLDEVPPNWKDHVSVVTGKRRKILPEFIADQASTINDADRLFEELTGQRSKIPLDEEHTKLITWLRENNCQGWWMQDHWMLVTHTYHLKEAHNALNLRGIFETTAKGTETPSDHNCFMFPMRRGAWTVRRYTPGVAEASTWDQDGAGWTRCTFNKEPNLEMAARANEGLEHPSGGYVFRHSEQAKKASELLGARVELPAWVMTRKSLLKEHKDGRLIFEIEQDSNDMGLTGMDGWIPEKGKWKRIFDVKASDPNEVDVGPHDDVVRHLVTQSGDDCGWVIKSDNIWKNEPLTHVRSGLKAMGFNMKESENIIGSSVFKPWTIVNKPFEGEYPAGREWNRNAPQFRFQPSEERENLSFPNWLKVLQHLGKGLDVAVANHPWCKANGVLTGADYLKCWIASLFQHPLEPLPYLFLYSGSQSSGKSTLHEALSLLLTHGVVRADYALTGNFNGELANAIVCVVEETDLRRNKQAYNKIKDWVTAKQLSIRALYQTPYLIPNATHWIQCSNDHLACPVFPGDTRITYIQVGDLKPEEQIPRRVFFPFLEKEAPDFMAELLNLEIPPSTDRLNIPVIITDEKVMAEKSNQTLLEAFIHENCHYFPGRMIKFSEFYDRFREWLDPSEVSNWSKIRLGRELPPRHPKGRVMAETGQFFIANISWEPMNGQPLEPRLVLKDDKLVKEGTQ